MPKASNNLHEPTVHSFSVNMITQGANKFFSLTMPTDVLGKTCFVSTRDDDPKQGFQRILDKNRAQDIADYIDSKYGSIPSAIILSAQPDAQLEIVNKGKTLRFTHNPKAFLILDGQHRVYGFSLAKSAIRVPVIIYNGLTRRDESRIFIDINTKQKPVPNELLLDIKSLAEYETDSEQYLNAIFTLFHDEPSSPLIGLTVSSDKSRNKISRVTFYTAFKPVLKVLSNRDPEDVFLIVSRFLNSCLRGLALKNSEEQITNTVVFKALISFFPVVARMVKDRYNEYHEDGFNDILLPLFQKIKESKFKKPGASYKDLTDYLEDSLETSFTL